MTVRSFVTIVAEINECIAMLERSRNETVRRAYRAASLELLAELREANDRDWVLPVGKVAVVGRAPRDEGDGGS